ncbi:POZ-, AT hook-, and zinc finger-containing protein 1 [Camponotus japonicus]
MMLAAATLYWSQSTGVHRQPLADHCRLSCPSCGRSYKYRSGLRSHMAECLSEREKLEADFLWQQQQQQQHQQWENPQAQSYRQQRQPLTAKDVRLLYKFWKS